MNFTAILGVLQHFFRCFKRYNNNDDAYQLCFILWSFTDRTILTNLEIDYYKITYMENLFTYALTVFMSFFAIMNPIANTPIFLGLVEGETEENKKKIAIIGAGPAGLAAASVAAQRGHQVILFDAAAALGGQFNIAQQLPGKEEFYATNRSLQHQFALHHFTLKLNTRVSADDLIKENFDEVILATGIKPRMPNIVGIENKKVLNYLDVLKYKKPVGKRVAVIGAGGIGFDVSEYLAHEGESTSLNIDAWLKEWGIDKTLTARSGIEGVESKIDPSPREIFMLKRSKGKFGGNLGKTTGWIHRSTLKKKNVQFINRVEYTKIDDVGLHYIQNEEAKILEVDSIVICAGQLPFKELLSPLEEANVKVHVIGGADVAAELDAKRAINQGCRLAAEI